jgi:hypothetical protein
MIVKLDKVNKTQYCPNDPICQFDILGSVENLTLTIGTTPPQPDTELTAEIIAPTGNITINKGGKVAFEGKVEGGTPPYTLQWTFGASGVNTSSALKPGELTFNKTGTYNVIMKTTDADEADVEDTVTVIVKSSSSNNDDDDNNNNDDDDTNNNPPVNTDTDGDGILNSEEIIPGEDGYITNANNKDTDSDGFEDATEIANGFDPTYNNSKSPFVDVPVTHNFYKYIIRLYNAHIVNGYDTSHYGPRGLTTRFELVKLVMRSLEIPVEANLPATFSDVPRDHEAYNYAHTAYKLGITTGVGDKFYPWKTVTRAEAVKIIINALVYQKKVTLTTQTGSGFNDVSPTDDFAKYIKTAVDNKIVSGYTPTEFRPFREIYREEISKIIVNAMSL